MIKKGNAITYKVEIRFIVALCILAAARVFFFSAIFPFFNNVDEISHVDLVVKYSRGYVPHDRVEHFETETARLIALYRTAEYMNTPVQFPKGFPLPLWGEPLKDSNPKLAYRVSKIERWPNHEAHSQPIYYVVSGYGEKADWFRNIMKTPKVFAQVGGRRFNADVERLSQERALEEFQDYAHRHPKLFKNIGMLIGIKFEGTQEEVEQVSQILPVIAFKTN